MERCITTAKSDFGILRTAKAALSSAASGVPGDFNSTWVGAPEEGEESLARILGIADHTPNHDDAHLDDFSSMHTGGCHMLAGDGAVHFVGETIDEGVWRSLGTLQGDELVGEF